MAIAETLNILLVSPAPKAGIERTDSVQPDPTALFKVTHDAREAMGLVEKQVFHAVVADSSLPDGSALAVLDRMRQMQPRSVRFLSTSTPDADLANRCIWNSHRIFDGVADRARIKSAVTEAMKVERWVSKPETRSLIASVRTFPTRPTTYFKILQLLDSSGADVDGLIELIRGDMAITTKIIQTVNSAIYSRTDHVVDLHEAVQILGFHSVKMLVISIQAVAQLDRVTPAYFSIDRIWKFSLQVAEAARKIACAEGLDAVSIDHAYLAGLLHDIGKAVFACNFDQQYSKVLEEVVHSRTPLVEAEQHAFGVSHAEVGAYLIALWGLPGTVVDAVGFHHFPSRSEGHAVDALTALYAANWITAEQPDAPEDSLYLDRLKVREKLQSWREQFGKPVKVPAPGHAPPAPTKPTVVDFAPRQAEPTSKSAGRFARFLSKLAG